MNEMSIMDKFADPALIETLSMGERAAGAGITTLMGMGITFMVLILLWGFIALMSKVITTAEMKQKEAEAPARAEINISTDDDSADMETVVIDDDQLTEEEMAAVIMAAIKAYRAETGAKSELIVRKIARTNGSSAPWGNAGIADCLESRKMN